MPCLPEGGMDEVSTTTLLSEKTALALILEWLQQSTGQTCSQVTSAVVLIVVDFAVGS